MSSTAAHHLPVQRRRGRKALAEEPGHGRHGHQPATVAVSPGARTFTSRTATAAAAVATTGRSPSTMSARTGRSPRRARPRCRPARPQGRGGDPDGRSVYVTNGGFASPGTISQYSVGAGGRLSPKSPATVATGTDPSHLAMTRPLRAGRAPRPTKRRVALRRSRCRISMGTYGSPPTPRCFAQGRLN